MTRIDSTEQSHGIYKYLPTCRSSTNTWLLFYYICPCYVEIHHAFYNRITIYCWPTCFSLSKTTQQNKQPWQKLMWPPTHYGVNQSKHVLDWRDRKESFTKHTIISTIWKEIFFWTAVKQTVTWINKNTNNWGLIIPEYPVQYQQDIEVFSQL